MFEQNNQLTEQSKEPVTNNHNGFSIPEADIHVMPKKDYQERKIRNRPLSPQEPVGPREFKRPAKPRQLNWLFLGILTFIVLGSLITVIIIFYMVTYRNQNQNQNQQNINQNTNTNPPSLINENNNQNLNLPPATALDRDQQRIKDIESLQNALNLYSAANNKYPDNLELLINNYLTALPKNPEPGGQDYSYSPQNENATYKILFSLEQEATYNNLSLGKGDYQATPSGIGLVMTNANVNQNLNTNTNPPIVPGLIQPGIDSDSDYLTDIEENLYQTEPLNPDTDGDTYLDGVEVRNLYSPKAAEIKLTETAFIKVFVNNSYNYQIYYPSDWVESALSPDFREIMFSSAIGEYVSVLIQDNPLGLSSLNWYQQYAPGIDPSALETLILSGLPAVKSIDGLNTYLAVGNKVFIINYNLGTSQQQNFETTYKMMLKSFSLTNLNNS